jgi:hypothetical protein
MMRQYISYNMKNYIYISKLKLWVEFFVDFFGGWQ